MNEYKESYRQSDMWHELAMTIMKEGYLLGLLKQFVVKEFVTVVNSNLFWILEDSAIACTDCTSIWQTGWGITLRSSPCK